MKNTCHTKTLKVCVLDKHAKVLRAWAFSVNQVWNYCNELSHRSIKERQAWLSRANEDSHHLKGKQTRV